MMVRKKLAKNQMIVIMIRKMKANQVVVRVVKVKVKVIVIMKMRMKKKNKNNQEVMELNLIILQDNELISIILKAI